MQGGVNFIFLEYRKAGGLMCHGYGYGNKDEQKYKILRISKTATSIHILQFILFYRENYTYSSTFSIDRVTFIGCVYVCPCTLQIQQGLDWSLSPWFSHVIGWTTQQQQKMASHLLGLKSQEVCRLQSTLSDVISAENRNTKQKEITEFKYKK